MACVSWCVPACLQRVSQVPRPRLFTRSHRRLRTRDAGRFDHALITQPVAKLQDGCGAQCFGCRLQCKTSGSTWRAMAAQ
jgi:hypothetical protein